MGARNFLRLRISPLIWLICAAARKSGTRKQFRAMLLPLISLMTLPSTNIFTRHKSFDRYSRTSSSVEPCAIEISRENYSSKPCKRSKTHRGRHPKAKVGIRSMRREVQGRLSAGKGGCKAIVMDHRGQPPVRGCLELELGKSDIWLTSHIAIRKSPGFERCI